MIEFRRVDPSSMSLLAALMVLLAHGGIRPTYAQQAPRSGETQAD
jgi:hypothetical protein